MKDPLRPATHLRLAADVLARRPAATTAIAGAVVAALNLWWVHRYRHAGAYNVDEVGYMATGLRYHRALDLGDPMRFLETVGAPSSTGPLVPLLTVPFLMVLGRGIPVLMLVQALIGVLAAVAMAGLVANLADRRAALLAGVTTLAVPAMVQSARGFQYAAAAAAFLCLAVWALLRSDRGHDRKVMLAFGAAVGLMLLSRTMAVGFLPGLGVAALVHVRRDRPSMVNLGLAGLVAGLVAGPWWIASREALYDYLFGFGYGSTSKHYGAAGFLDRMSTRWTNVATDLRVLRWIGLLVVVALGIELARRRLDRAGRSLPRPRRDHATVALVIVLGAAALLTTRNQGVWFELPLELLAIALVLASTKVLGAVLRRVAEVATLIVAGLTLGLSVTDPGGEIDPTDRSPSTREQAQLAFYGGLIEKERPLADADPRLLSNDLRRRSEAAADWWAANEELAETLEDHRVAADGLLMITVSGNSHLVNGQSMLLAQELRSLPLSAMEVPDTEASDDELERFLEPRWRGTHDRVLVLIRSRSLPFPEDRRVPHLHELAAARGWQQAERIPLPDGGDILLLRHPTTST